MGSDFVDWWVHSNLFDLFLSLGNLSFVSIVGSTESKWTCTYADGTAKNISHPTTKEQCDSIKDCKTLTAIKGSSEFYSIVANFTLICDQANKPEIIQIIQAASLVSFYNKFCSDLSFL